MSKGYPMAFNNMANALQLGKGIAKDEGKAADLYLETFNRVLQCCWAPVARQILAEEDKHDKAAMRRVVGELTRWSAALGSEPAQELLIELNANGSPSPGDAFPRAKFTDPPPWFN
jgi:hypothetical protein